MSRQLSLGVCMCEYKTILPFLAVLIFVLHLVALPPVKHFSKKNG